MRRQTGFEQQHEGLLLQVHLLLQVLPMPRSMARQPVAYWFVRETEPQRRTGLTVPAHLATVAQDR